MDAADLTPGTTSSDIVELLYSDEGSAYTVTDVADRLDIPREDAAVGLARLHRSELVAVSGGSEYRALDEREDLRRYCAACDQSRLLFDTYD